MKDVGLNKNEYNDLINEIVNNNLKKYDLDEKEFKIKFDAIAHSSMKRYDYDPTKNLACNLSITFYINDNIDRYIIFLARSNNEIYKKLSHNLMKSLRICYNISNIKLKKEIDVSYYMEYAIMKTIENYPGKIGIDLYVCKWFLGLIKGKLNEESNSLDEYEKVLVK